VLTVPEKERVVDENEELSGYLQYQSGINPTVFLKMRCVGISLLMLTMVGW
jgi:hypothetical protein